VEGNFWEQQTDIELKCQMLLLSAQSVAGPQHKGRHSGDVRWRGSQNGFVAIGHAKLKVKRPDYAAPVPKWPSPPTTH